MTIMKPQAQFQIGKNGITDEAIVALNSLLETRKQVRITMLPASGRNSSNIKQMAQEIESRLLAINRPVYTKVIGFIVIVLRKGLGHDSKPKKK